MTSYSIFLFLIWHLRCLQGPKGPPGHKGEFGLPGRPVGIRAPQTAGGRRTCGPGRPVALLRPLSWVSGSPRTEWPQRRQRRSRGHDPGECHTRGPAPQHPGARPQGQGLEGDWPGARSLPADRALRSIPLPLPPLPKIRSPALSSGSFSGGPTPDPPQWSITSSSRPRGGWENTVWESSRSLASNPRCSDSSYIMSFLDYTFLGISQVTGVAGEGLVSVERTQKLSRLRTQSLTRWQTLGHPQCPASVYGSSVYWCF